MSAGDQAKVKESGATKKAATKKTATKRSGANQGVTLSAAAKLAGCKPAEVVGFRDLGESVSVVWCDDALTYREVFPK